MMKHSSTARGSAEPALVRPGRKLDPSRDAAILDATLELLTEVDYTRLTMSMVATRAKAGKGTVYRRWQSKEELVLDAVARLSRTRVDQDILPDTGCLRDDLLALFVPESSDRAGHQVQIAAGLTSLLSVDQMFVDATNAALIKPWAAAHLVFLQRAMDRGEIPPDRDIELLSQLVARLAAYRTMIERRPFTGEFLADTVDEILLPAVHFHGSEPVPHRGGTGGDHPR